MVDFEKSIDELKNKIMDLQVLSELEDADFSTEISKLQDKISYFEKEKYKNLSAWEKVNLARKLERPKSLYYIREIFDDFIELHGDRHFADDESIVGGIASFNGIPVTVIGQQKGSDINENIRRNFGSPHPEGYRKALRLMKQSEKFKRPIICFIDTQGAFPGVGAEERGQGEAIARNLYEMSILKTPIISIIAGEGGSGGALALAVSDKVWMLEHAFYSILSPEGFASILYRDATKGIEAAEDMKSTAQDLYKFGIIDKIIDEPLGGSHKDPYKMTNTIKELLEQELKEIIDIPIDELVMKRYEKYRNIGKYTFLEDGNI